MDCLQGYDSSDGEVDEVTKEDGNAKGKVVNFVVKVDSLLSTADELKTENEEPERKKRRNVEHNVQNNERTSWLSKVLPPPQHTHENTHQSVLSRKDTSIVKARPLVAPARIFKKKKLNSDKPSEVKMESEEELILDTANDTSSPQTEEKDENPAEPSTKFLPPETKLNVNARRKNHITLLAQKYKKEEHERYSNPESFTKKQQGMSARRKYGW